MFLLIFLFEFYNIIQGGMLDTSLGWKRLLWGVLSLSNIFCGLVSNIYLEFGLIYWIVLHLFFCLGVGVGSHKNRFLFGSFNYCFFSLLCFVLCVCVESLKGWNAMHYIENTSFFYIVFMSFLFFSCFFPGHRTLRGVLYWSVFVVNLLVE